MIEFAGCEKKRQMFRAADLSQTKKFKSVQLDLKNTFAVC